MIHIENLYFDVRNLRSLFYYPNRHLIFIGVILFLLTQVNASAQLQSQTNSNSFNETASFDSTSWDSYGEDFLQGKPLILRKSLEKESSQRKDPPKEAMPSLKIPRPNTGEQSVSVQWLRKNYIVLEERAIDNPSTENIEAYLYTKRIILDKAQNFSLKVDEVSKADPFLNENNRIPYASSGANSIRNTNILAQQAAIREMSISGGVYVFVDSKCPFCALQLPVLKFLNEQFGLQLWVISIDGVAPQGYKGQLAKDNGLYKKLGLKLTPSVVYLNHPAAYNDGVDPNKYLIISQGYYAADELTKVMAYAAYKTDLLSDKIKLDLNLWDRGLASPEDLEGLKLDANNPASFKPKLQPMLEKNY